MWCGNAVHHNFSIINADNVVTQGSISHNCVLHSYSFWHVLFPSSYSRGRYGCPLPSWIVYSICHEQQQYQKPDVASCSCALAFAILKVQFQWREEEREVERESERERVSVVSVSGE